MKISILSSFILIASLAEAQNGFNPIKDEADARKKSLKFLLVLILFNPLLRRKKPCSALL